MKNFTLMMAALLMTVLSAKAEDRMSAEDVTIKPGETAEIVISLDNDVDVYGWQTKITLPEGISLVYDEDDEDYVYELASARHNKNWTLSILDVVGIENTWYFAAYNTKLQALKQTTGEVISITIKADASFAGGKANFFENEYSDESNVGHQMPDFTINIDVPGAAVVKYAPATEQSTFCSDKDLDFSEVSELTAYVATEYKNGYVTLTEVQKVPAGTGLFIVATATGSDIEIPVAATTDAIGTNLLKGVTADTDIDATDGSNTNFVLSGGAFVPVTAGTLSAGRAYLQLPTADVASAAKVNISFGSASGIQTIGTQAADNAPAYNVAGQKVGASYKGLVIRNGVKRVQK